jgi:hypothetical protein
MLKKNYPNSIPQSIISSAVAEYNSYDSYETTGMKKAKPNSILDKIIPICEKTLDLKLKYCGGNYYHHSTPYLPHTDYKLNQDNSINLVIPLEYTGEQASLIVFDQAWHKDSVTWCLNHEVLNFSVNTGVKGSPYQYPDVKNLTKIPLDIDFYEKYLSHHPIECFWGLSGNAFLFQPSSLIAFDNRLIHCTSHFKGEKLGLSLRFKIL